MANVNFNLESRTALVTGGGTGIGLAIATAFVAAGARVIVTGRREEVLREACAAIGQGASYRVCDVADVAATRALVQGFAAEGIEIDILVNNAGINFKKPALELEDADFERIVQTNLNGLFCLTREVARGMAERKHGAILNISSMAALYGLPYVAAYAASKTAVVGLTRALAVEFAPHGVRVNAIAPGFITSAMTDRALNSDPERKRRVMERTPMARMGRADEVASAAVFLCSDAANFITGVNLPVDGGNSIGF